MGVDEKRRLCLLLGRVWTLFGLTAKLKNDGNQDSQKWNFGLEPQYQPQKI